MSWLTCTDRTITNRFCRLIDSLPCSMRSRTPKKRRRISHGDFER